MQYMHITVICGFWILFRGIILVFHNFTAAELITYQTEIGPGLEQFKQIRTNLRFSDPIYSSF